MKPARLFSFLVSLVLLAIVVACSKTVTRVVPTGTADAGTDSGKVTTTPSGDDDDDDKKSDDDDKKSDDDDDKKSDDDDDDAPPKVSDCKKKTGQQECATCCQQIAPEGAVVYSKLVKDCLCNPDGGTCVDECKKTLCANKQPSAGDTCSECMSGAVCSDIPETCNADAKCKVFNDCVTKAECPNKP